MLSKKQACPSCGAQVAPGIPECPSCGTVLNLKRGSFKGPSQMMKDLSKFIIVAVLFVIVLVPLGFCVRPG